MSKADRLVDRLFAISPRKIDMQRLTAVASGRKCNNNGPLIVTFMLIAFAEMSTPTSAGTWLSFSKFFNSGSLVVFCFPSFY